MQHRAYYNFIFGVFFFRIIMAALCNRGAIIFLPCNFYLLLFSPPNLSGRRLDVYHTLTHGVALVRIKNAGLKCVACGSLPVRDAKKVTKNRHLGTIAQLCRAISSQLRHISTIAAIGKNFLRSNISSTCPHNMVNFGPLAAEIVSLVWGTTANFNGFRVLAALLHGTLVVGVCQTAAFNRGRHLYSAGGHHVRHWPTFLVAFDIRT